MSRVKREKSSTRRIFLLIFLVFSIISIIFFAADGRFRTPVANKTVALVLSPFEKGISWIGSQFRYVTSSIWEIVTVYNQNKMLRNEVEQLRTQNLQASEYAAENERLRTLLGYKQSALQFDMVAARVIGREAASWSNMIIIDRGNADGIADRMPVVTEKGLVGHVVEADINTSKVQLILDSRSSVGALVQRPESRVAGIVKGDTTNSTMPRIVDIPKTADVVEGDVIVTSGFGGMYPKGLIIGTVSNLGNDTGGLLKYGVIETAVDFQKLEDVMVIIKSREAPPTPLTPPKQTPGTETNPEEGTAN